MSAIKQPFHMERKCWVILCSYGCEERSNHKAPSDPILGIIRKNAVHASLKAVDAARECPA